MARRRIFKPLYLMLAAAVFGAGFAVAWFTFASSTPTDNSAAIKYPLLAKRLFLENPNDIIVDFIPLRTAIRQYLGQMGHEHSFYFEYLPSGTSIRAEENNKLAGASLLKLPTIISLYKAVELGKADLDQEVSIKEEWLDQGFGDLWRKGAGTRLTLREAVRLALIDSDNTAIKTIRGTLGDTIHGNETVLSQLDVEFPYTIDGQSQVSARDYATVLRCLYLSCYLNPEHSQDILNQLAEAPDFNRIAAGVPDGTKVAHKIGVFGSEAQSDCGVIYVPNRPYVLCVIIKGSSDEVDGYMRTLSKLIYDFVNDRSR